MTNYNHKNGLMVTCDMMSSCSREAALFYPYRRVLTLAGTGLFRRVLCKKNDFFYKNVVVLT